MRNITLVSALVILLVLPNLAAAGTLEGLSGTADCNMWSADLTISFRTASFMTGVEYAVVLVDAAGAEVERFDYSEFIDVPLSETAVFSFSDSWTSVLDGDYTVTADFTVFDIFGDGHNLSSDSFTAALACGSTSGDGDPVRSEPCLYTASYWADHPDQWPVSSLDFGGLTKAQPELLQMLQIRGNRLVGIALMRELIATRLNLANGGNTDIQAIVDQATASLAGLPEGNTRTSGQSRSAAMRLLTKLAKYNRLGCPDGNDSGVSMQLDWDSSETLAKAAIESMTLGTIKAMYR